MPEIIPPKTESGNALVKFEGSFECHVCHEWVWDALYDPSKETLSWTCETGHISKIDYRYG